MQACKFASFVPDYRFKGLTWKPKNDIEGFMFRFQLGYKWQFLSTYSQVECLVWL